MALTNILITYLNHMSVPVSVEEYGQRSYVCGQKNDDFLQDRKTEMSLQRGFEKCILRKG